MLTERDASGLAGRLLVGLALFRSLDERRRTRDRHSPPQFLTDQRRLALHGSAQAAPDALQGGATPGGRDCSHTVGGPGCRRRSEAGWWPPSCPPWPGA